MYILVGSQHSLYTGKLRAYLRWKNIPFEEITASQEIYKQLILPRTGVAYIPVLVCTDSTTVLQDSHAIIQQLEQQHPHAVLPHTPRQRLASMLLELYGDEWMLLPAMHYRWSFPEQHTTYMQYQFGKTSRPDDNYEQQLAVGAKVASHFSGMLPSLGISPVTSPVIEARFKWQLGVLQQHLQQLPYLLSARQPSSADFGLIGPLHAHLYIDPVPGCLLKSSAPLVADWVERTCGICAVQHSAGCNNIVTIKPKDPARPQDGSLLIIRRDQLQQQQQQQPNAVSNVSAIAGYSTSASTSSRECFPAGDVVPATLLPLLRHMFLEQMPVMHSTVQLLQQWLHKHQHQGQCQQQQQKAARRQVPVPPGFLLLPRTLGLHSFQLFDPTTNNVAATGKRVAMSYTAWRAAEIVDWYEGLCVRDRDAAQQLLREVSSSTAVAKTAETGCSSWPAEATAGSVDAVAAFEKLVGLVRSCGCIVRNSNHIMVKPAVGWAHSKL